jgi:predicted acylesterase/phospholipase RssA
MTPTQPPGSSIFEGLSRADLAAIEGRMSPRRFNRGETLIVQGTSPRELLIIREGLVDIVIDAGGGQATPVGQIGPGGVVGEMSLFTGLPTSATVMAATTVHTLVMDETTFHDLGPIFPRLYLNLGTILSEKLALSNRARRGSQLHRVVALTDAGGPPLMPLAIAAAVTWHSRQKVLLVHLLPAGSEVTSERVVRSGELVGAEVHEQWEAAEGAFDPARLGFTLDTLCDRYGHVLLCCAPSVQSSLDVHRHFILAGSDARPAEAGHRTVRGWLSEASEPWRTGQTLDLPAPTRGEEGEIAAGALSPRCALGRSIGRLAREITRTRIGVALGAGGSKGYAHVGVLAALDAIGVPIDVLAGTSIGACVAAMYAAGYRGERISSAIDEVGNAAWRFTFPHRSLSSNTGLRLGLQHVFGQVRFEELPRPLAVVAADLVTEQEVVMREGLLWPALLASSSIPGVWPPQRIGKHILIDGGTVNPVPADVASDLGADVVLAVKLSKRPSLQSARLVAEPSADAGPSIVQTTLRAIEIMQSKIERTLPGLVIPIDVQFSDEELPGLRQFSRGRRFIELGRRAVLDREESISAALPWVTRQG